MANTVLVVVAHPDDEILLCGGAMAKHVANWEPVHVLIMSSGVGSRGTDSEKERMDSLFKASQVICYTVEVLDFPDQQLDTVPILSIIQEIEKRIRNLKPTLVYTHWTGDMNKDHRITADATMVACRPQPGQTVKTLLMGEVCSSTEWAGGFNPNWYSDITIYMPTKLEACRCYESEMRKWPHPRSVSGVWNMAEYRGGTVGVCYAEAFECRRMVV